MGLDGVELVMEIEDEFGISIGDEDAEKLTTVGQTAAYVVDRLRQKSPGPVAGAPVSTAASPARPSASAFYQLRRELRSRFGVSRRRVLPSSRIGDLVSARADRERWNDLAIACGFLRERGSLFSPGFPAAGMTVRRLIHSRYEDGLAYGSLYLADGDVNTRAVWFRLRTIIVQQLGVEESELKWDTHYVNDLHID